MLSLQRLHLRPRSLRFLPIQSVYGATKRPYASHSYSASPIQAKARNRTARIGASVRKARYQDDSKHPDASGNSGGDELEFGLRSLQRIFKLPTRDGLPYVYAKQTKSPWVDVSLVVECLGGTYSMTEEPMLSSSGSQFFRAHHTVRIPGQPSVLAAGDGSDPRQAKHAASLHILAKMSTMGLLETPKQLAFSAKKTTLDSEADEGMLDIYNYAARHHCIPSISICENDGVFRVTIEMPAHGISVKTSTHGSPKVAVVQAARQFRKDAEMYHLRQGTEAVTVRDRYALNTYNASSFFTYCHDKGESFEHLDVAVRKYGPTRGDLMWAGIPWLGHPSFELPLVMVKTASKGSTLNIAKLVAALSITEKKPHLLDGFTQALREGKGKYLPKVKPEEVVLGPKVIQDLDAVHDLNWPYRDFQAGSTPSETGTEFSREMRRRRVLSPERLSEKSSALRKKMDEYNSRKDLENLRQKRSELPMTKFAPDVIRTVNSSVYSIIIGATGSGKTTQVPQILLDQAIKNGTGASCNIICTQPRRIAATSVAQRVAIERAEKLQDTVGYHVRADPRLPKPGGSIVYCTAGILLQQLQHAPDDIYDHISHLVIDEVHERDLINDFLLIALKYTMAARAAQGKKVPHVVLMSATIDPEQFAAYFGGSLPSGSSAGCPILTVPGRTFPVKEYYLGDILGKLNKGYHESQLRLLRTHKPTENYLKAENDSRGHASAAGDPDTSPEFVVDWEHQSTTARGEFTFHTNKDDSLVPLGLVALAVAHITKTSETGAILVFLTGLAEIEELEDILRSQSPLGVNFNDRRRFQIIMLHSSMQDNQTTVFEQVPEGCRKVILSTNIAETSVTIPDVRFVVDTGKSREKQYDQMRRISHLQCSWISKSNVKQRAGRAGRVQDGVYYALFTRSRHESMRSVGLPELLRSDLQETCLDVKVQAFKMPVADFLAGAMEPPPASAVEIAMQKLTASGALTEDEELTPLGRVLASLPVHPTLGKMIIMGIIFRCLDPMIILGAAAHERPLFGHPPQMQSSVDKMKKKFAKKSDSDHIMLLNVFRHIRQAFDQTKDTRRALDMLRREYYINPAAIDSINLTAQEIVMTLTESGLIRKQHMDLKNSSKYGGFKNSPLAQYGGSDLNQHSGSEALIKALLVAGLYPNLAVHTSRGRFHPEKGLFQTSAEKDTKMHPSSVNYGQKTPKNIYTYNTLSLSLTTKSMFLRDTSCVTPLMVLLFGGPLVQHGETLMMDQWLPMTLKAAPRGPGEGVALTGLGDGGAPISDRIVFLRGLVDGMLAEAFRDLARRVPLAEDPTRADLVSRLAAILSHEAAKPERPVSGRQKAGKEKAGKEKARKEKAGKEKATARATARRRSKQPAGAEERMVAAYLRPREAPRRSAGQPASGTAQARKPRAQLITN